MTMRTYQTAIERLEADPDYRDKFEAARQDLARHTFIGVNKGWLPIVVSLHIAILETEPEFYEIDQIKEKFGGLRYYWRADEAHYKIVDELVRAAEELAAKTCEICGAPGTLRTERSWLLTLCDRHNIDQPLYWDAGYTDEEKEKYFGAKSADK